MKFFAFIMAILVLALSCMPCADSAGALKDGKSGTEFTKSSTQQDEDHEDGCSPFCQCTCCAGFSINHSSTAVTALIIFNSKSFTPYLPANTIEVSIPVWQPPQL